MDTRTLIIIVVAVAIKALALGWWLRFKERRAAEPIPTKQRNGVFVPWGPIEKVQHYGWRGTQLWLVYIGVLISALVYTKVIQPLG